MEPGVVGTPGGVPPGGLIASLGNVVRPYLKTTKKGWRYRPLP